MWTNHQFFVIYPRAISQKMLILQTKFKNGLSWMKISEFRLRFHWSLFPRIQLTMPPLVQIMALQRSGDNPLSEPTSVSILTHICITRPQWVNEANEQVSLRGKRDINILIKWPQQGYRKNSMFMSVFDGIPYLDILRILIDNIFVTISPGIHQA